MVMRGWRGAAFVLGVVILAGTAWLHANPPHQRDPALTARALLPDPIITSGVFASPPAAASTQGAPLRIRVPALQIDLPLVEGDGFNVPLYKAAVYPKLKAPGEGGRSLIYAHGRDGMFGPLFHAQVGQEIFIEREGGAQLRYVISRTVPRWPATDLSVLQASDHEELVLLTCTTYNVYDPRIVVFAEPE